MNWRRSKNVIIIVLVIANLFLLAMVGLQARDSDQSGSDSGDALADTLSLLESNGIKVETSLPDVPQGLGSLTVSYGRYDKNIVKNAMEHTRALSEAERTDDGYADAAEAFLKKCGFSDTYAVLLGTTELEDGRVLVEYDNVYYGTPVEDCYTKVYFEDGSIVDFDRKWMEIVSEGDTSLEIMPARSALLKFMTETDSAGASEETQNAGADTGALETDPGSDTPSITVEDMYIVYWIDNYDVEGDVLYDTALPAWCICYNGGQKAYISASE